MPTRLLMVLLLIGPTQLAWADGTEEAARLKRNQDEAAKRRIERLKAARDDRIVIDPPARTDPLRDEKWSVVIRDLSLEQCAKLLAHLTGKRVTLNGRIARNLITLELGAETRSEVVPLFRPALQRQGIALTEFGLDGLLLAPAPKVSK